MDLKKCFTVKRSYVRAIVYNFNSTGAIVYTDACIPDKGLTVERRKEIVTGYLVEKGFKVSGDSF